MSLALPPTALTLLVAIAGLAAVAVALSFLHAAMRNRDDADAAIIAALHAYYLDLDVLEQQPTVPLLDTPVARSGDNLDEQRA